MITKERYYNNFMLNGKDGFNAKMKYWIIADTHFNHSKIIDYCNRPKNHEALMLKELSTIKETDCLIHLGDICIGNDTIVHGLIKNLKCRKILVKGNHDSKSYSWYMEHGWDFVCDVFKIKYAGKIICLSHKPQPWDGDWEINVHGHLHNLGHRDNDFKNLKQWHRLYSPEIMNYKPVELSNFIQKEPQ